MQKLAIPGASRVIATLGYIVERYKCYPVAKLETEHRTSRQIATRYIH